MPWLVAFRRSKIEGPQFEMNISYVMCEKTLTDVLIGFPFENSPKRTAKKIHLCEEKNS